MTKAEIRLDGVEIKIGRSEANGEDVSLWFDSCDFELSKQNAKILAGIIHAIAEEDE